MLYFLEFLRIFSNFFAAPTIIVSQKISNRKIVASTKLHCVLMGVLSATHKKSEYPEVFTTGYSNISL
ncbi:MAG: hypothetical protein RSF40_06985 [Oscillospiraceae bacterium]